MNSMQPFPFQTTRFTTAVAAILCVAASPAPPREDVRSPRTEVEQIRRDQLAVLFSTTAGHRCITRHPSLTRMQLGIESWALCWCLSTTTCSRAADSNCTSTRTLKWPRSCWKAVSTVRTRLDTAG